MGNVSWGRRDLVPALRAAPAGRRKLEGIFPIGFTPTTANDAIDYEGLAAQVRFCQRGAVQGFCWPQIASGWTVLTPDERLHGAEAILSAAKGGQTAVLIGVQSKTGDFTEIERYVHQAESLGADGVICIPPPGINDEDSLLTFYQRVGKLTSLPLFAQTGGDFSVDLLVRMFDSISNFRHVKDEAGDPLTRVSEITQRTNGGLKCFSGRGVTTLITEMDRGFVGHCPFVSLADLYASAFSLYHAGHQRQAFDQFGRILAAGSMFPQSDIDILIARGVLRPGTSARVAPPASGAEPRRRNQKSSEEIRRDLDMYLKPNLKV
jgi:dihydrodipicolinate synthase/N-acetylneuraminate lyase